jgi:hypothetical protein
MIRQILDLIGEMRFLQFRSATKMMFEINILSQRNELTDLTAITSKVSVRLRSCEEHLVRVSCPRGRCIAEHQGCAAVTRNISSSPEHFFGNTVHFLLSYVLMWFLPSLNVVSTPVTTALHAFPRRTQAWQVRRYCGCLPPSWSTRYRQEHSGPPSYSWSSVILTILTLSYILTLTTHFLSIRLHPFVPFNMTDSIPLSEVSTTKGHATPPTHEGNRAGPVDKKPSSRKHRKS